MDGELPAELSKLRGASRTQAAVREKDTGNEYIRSGEPKRAIRSRRNLLGTNDTLSEILASYFYLPQLCLLSILLL